MAETLDDREPVFRTRFFEILAIEPVGFFEARDPDDALNVHLHFKSLSSADPEGGFNLAAGCCVLEPSPFGDPAIFPPWLRQPIAAQPTRTY